MDPEEKKPPEAVFVGAAGHMAGDTVKIMLLIPHIAGGGGEKVLSELAHNLGTDVTLVLFEERFSYPFAGRVICLNMPVNRGSLFRRAYGFLRRGLRFMRVLRTERPDVVVSFMGEANLLNALLAPHPVVTVHNHLSAMSGMRPMLESVISDALVRWSYGRATVVAVSEAIKKDLTSAFRLSQEQVVVIPNPVDEVRVRELAAESVNPPWDPDLPVIVTVGRLSKEKGQWHLIRAFAEARKSVPCQLAILGSGELEGPLRRLSRELGVEKHTCFLGWQSNPFKYVARSTVFVLPSLTEGFGLALVEAMACGVPVIATDCPGGSGEIIAPGGPAEFGVLVRAQDGLMHGADRPCTPGEEELAAAILRMLKDDALRAGYAAAGARRARDFRYDAFSDSYRRLIAKAAAGKG